jgi:hypothetical protein
VAGINQRIIHQTEKYQWEFMFLGANQDAIATAARMGIHAHHAATFAADADDIQAGTAVFAKRVATSRKASMMCRLNAQEAATLKESVAETLEKSRKERK